MEHFSACVSILSLSYCVASDVEMRILLAEEKQGLCGRCFGVTDCSFVCVIYTSYYSIYSRNTAIYLISFMRFILPHAQQGSCFMPPSSALMVQ